jgi:myosin heavy subunit
LKSNFLEIGKLDKDNFCILHTADKVIYRVEGFVEKNKDEISLDLE